ncbi:MAG: alpha/beta family hydrolase [Anaeromyxobacter sp.]
MQLDLHGPAGRLEALLDDAPDARFAALVCHPHPRFGGTMHNHATYRLAKAVRAAGGLALRFNYRGVGRSGGTYDRARGEADDARAALAWLALERPELPRLALGFSFGAWMASIAGGEDPGVRALVIAGLALRSPDPDLTRDVEAVRRAPQPLALVQAERDEYGSPADVEAALEGSAGPRRVSIVRGATHLFTEDLAGLQREAEAALAWALDLAGLAGAPAGGEAP